MKKKGAEEEGEYWSREEEKTFENAIAIHWSCSNNSQDQDQDQDRWDNIASMVPTKTLSQLKQHYKMLVHDLNLIEAGLVPIPSYTSEEEEEDDTNTTKKDHHQLPLTTSASSTDRRSSNSNNYSGNGFARLSSHHRSSKHGSRSDQERRKGIPWTEEEHRLFLLGLDKFGKGDWRSISRNFVISRTPTQVASHAQKYFIRLNSMNRERRRSSIHDITSLNTGDVSSPQGPPITGQHMTSSTTPDTGIGGSGHPSMMLRPPPPPNMAGMGMYGAPMGQPVAAPSGHMVSAVGTPVMFPPPGHHPPYIVPVAYPVAPQLPTLHQ